VFWRTYRRRRRDRPDRAGGPVYTSRVWLTREESGRLAVRGALELQGARVKVLLDDRRAPGPILDWLEQRLGERGVARDLSRGDGHVLVDRPVLELGFMFRGPAQDLEVIDERGPWLLRFTQPGAAEVMGNERRRQERKSARWKELLAAAVVETNQ